ncbi:MFS transporter [Nocardia sp. NPDC058499]|uniref:MFS transporter n=1 Tax=Nocardia sp. NPDC058499 TaxID=3346530 RepID=UPI00364E080B
MIAITLLLEVFSISYMMVATALPAISAHFRTSDIAWTVTAFGLTGAVISPLVAKLALMYGKRLILTICVGISSVGALISALAPNFGILLAGRAIFGFLVPCLFLSYLLIRDVFPPRTVPLAISIVTSGMGLIAIPAPFLTGWLLDGFGFRSVFWFFFVITIVLVGVIRFMVDESTVRVRSRLDIVGATLLGGGVAGVLIAISFGPKWGWTATGTALFLLGGLALLGAWGLSAKRIRDPLIDLAVLIRRSVLLTVTSSGIVYGISGLFGTLLPTMVMVPIAFDLGYGWGLSAEEFALRQLPIAAAIVVGGVVVGVLMSRRMPPRVALIAGLSVSVVGFTLMAIAHGNIVTVVLAATVMGFGEGMAYSAVPNLIVTTVEVEHQAETASIVSVAKGIFSATLALVVFTVLNNSFVATTVEGAPFYSYRGFTTAFAVGAGVAAIGLVLALALPRRGSVVVDSGVGDDRPQATESAAVEDLHVWSPTSR